MPHSKTTCDRVATSPDQNKWYQDQNWTGKPGGPACCLVFYSCLRTSPHNIVALIVPLAPHKTPFSSSGIPVPYFQCFLLRPSVFWKMSELALLLQLTLLEKVVTVEEGIYLPRREAYLLLSWEAPP